MGFLKLSINKINDAILHNINGSYLIQKIYIFFLMAIYMNQNMFITLEGIDGAGKDIQLLNLIEIIRDDKNGIIADKYANIWVTREPTHLTESGKKISKLIREGNVDLETAKNLYVNDRKEHSIIIREMLKHSIVISSRFDISTLAFQNAQGESIEELYKMHGFENNECITPDLTIFFDVSADIGYARTLKRAEKKECFENLDFLRKVESSYKQVIDFLKNKGRNIIIIDANQSIEDVKDNMLSKLTKIYKKYE